MESVIARVPVVPGGRPERHRPELLEGRRRGVGVHDGLSARIAGDKHFDFLWLSSFGMSAAAGLPDVGIIGPEDVARTLRVIARVSDLPIVVDLDAGHGDPVRIRYVVEDIALAGAAAVCLEDNPIAKRCSLYAGYARELVSIEEHAARIRGAVLGAQAAGGCAVIARTEALVAGFGVDEALERADAYVEAGADAVFVQCVRPETGELFEFCERWALRTPVFIAPTAFPDVPASGLFARGATHVIYANQLVRAAHQAMAQALETITANDGVHAGAENLDSVKAVAATVGESDIAHLEAHIFNPPSIDVRVVAASMKGAFA